MTTPPYHPAMVLGLSPTGLAVARSLAPRGVRVFGVDADRMEIGHFSRWVENDPRIAYLPAGDALLAGLVEVGRALPEKPVIFTGGDAYIDFVAENRDALLEHYVLAESMCEEVNSIFVNKRTFYERAESLGIAMPRTFFPKTSEEAAACARQLRFPAIVKPTLGHLFRSKLDGQKLVQVHDAESALRWWNQFQEWGGDSVLQEEIVGPEANIYVAAVYMDRDLECRSLFTACKTRQYPPMYGSGSYIEAEWSQEIADISIDILRKLEYRGVCGTEFKWDERDEAWKLIEVNCRPTLWFAICRKAGVDVIWDAYCDLIGHPNPVAIGRQDDSVRWQLLVRDIVSAIHFMRKGELSVREFIRTVVSPFKKEYAVLSWRDMRVNFAYPLNSVAKYWAAFHSQ